MEGKKVLFVDDEENILSSLKRAMISEPYTCYFAESGEEALKIMEENKIDIVVSDMKMPNMTGLELMRKVKEMYPDMIKIILSGYAQLTQVIATVNSVDLYKFLLKPWKNEDIYETLGDASNYIDLLNKKNVEINELIKQADENTNKDDIQNMKLVSSKFLKNINFMFSTENQSFVLDFLGDFEKVYQAYIDSLPTAVAYYYDATLIEMLENNICASLRVYGNNKNNKYTGNIILIQSLINELLDYLFKLLKKREVDVEYRVLEEKFEIQFKIPLTLMMNTDENITKELKIFPRYMDLLRESLTVSGVALTISNNESEIYLLLSNT